MVDSSRTFFELLSVRFRGVEECIVAAYGGCFLSLQMHTGTKVQKMSPRPFLKSLAEILFHIKFSYFKNKLRVLFSKSIPGYLTPIS